MQLHKALPMWRCCLQLTLRVLLLLLLLLLLLPLLLLLVV
jgi:hypothetical protein